MKRLCKLLTRANYLFIAGLVVAQVIGLASSASLKNSAQPELRITLSVSPPANGSYFDVGEQAAVKVVLKDTAGAPLSLSDFSTLNLYLYGPVCPQATRTAVKMLNASTDRSKQPHHYIDLLTNPEVQVNRNLLHYTLRPVSTEEPGTYTASVWAVLKTDSLMQTMKLTDLQIKTATREKQVVEKRKCAVCHEGASSGKMYHHHIDPPGDASNVDPPDPSAKGNWSLDFVPVRTCKSCHNQDGYASYSDPASPTGRTSDPIVRRVHGVHMGEGLQNPFNIAPDTGDFRKYRDVLFPPDIRNCTFCHVDDRWKTEPSRFACTACHDTVRFDEITGPVPVPFKPHIGGPQNDDTQCSRCHPPDTGGAMPVAEAHKVPPPPLNEAVVSMTPPRNGRFFVAGETPMVTIVIKDDKGNPLADHTKVNNTNFSTAGLFVYGPRYRSKPVLTSTAKNGGSKYRASVSNSIAASGTPTKGWTFSAGDTFKIAVNGNPFVVLAAPVGLKTPANVRDWLKADPNFKDVTVTSNDTAGTVSLRSNLQGANSRFEIYNSPVTTIMGWKPGGLPLARGGMTTGTTMEPYVIIGQSSYAINDLRKLSDPLDYSDPNVIRNVENITYQLGDVAGLPPGTYMIYVWVQPIYGGIINMTQSTIGFMTFQIGTQKEEPKVATNCTNCHGDTIWHLYEGPQHPEPFNPDYCKACHDYGRIGTGDGFARLGGTSTSGWSGFGAVPIVRRVHGVHFARYLEYPEMIYAGNPNAFNWLIFPQDVRNCTKCHGKSNDWAENPSRLACLACHDSTQAADHARQYTTYPTPQDPWSGDEVETCKNCHGPGGVKAVADVHNISNPYKPPYVRDP